MRKQGTLIIFSGLPGSGKSTLAMKLASALSATFVRIDTVEQGLRELCDISEIDGKGYALSYRVAQDNLRLGNIVIADSVNPEDFTRKEWNAVATDIGADFINVEIFCSNKSEHRHRVESRGPSVQGSKPPTWEDVLNRTYHPWTDERIAMDTAGKTVEKSFEDLLIAIKARLNKALP